MQQAQVLPEMGCRGLAWRLAWTLANQVARTIRDFLVFVFWHYLPSYLRILQSSWEYLELCRSRWHAHFADPKLMHGIGSFANDIAVVRQR